MYVISVAFGKYFIILLLTHVLILCTFLILIKSCVIKYMYRLHSLFEVEDIVTVMAKKVNGHWSVNNDHGFVTRHSDFLVSGTTIVGSLFCSRRSILADIYKGLDCSSAVMVIGTLLHQLFQTVNLKIKLLNY